MDEKARPSLPAPLGELAAALSRPLPGKEAQELMLPSMRRGQPIAPPPGESWRPAAVLVLIHPDGAGGFAFPLVERSAAIGRHRGEVGLPGGSLEPGESDREAALRETGEELGLAPDLLGRVELLGRLSPLKVPPSGFEIFPWVAWIDHRPEWRPEYPEIEGVLEFPLARLAPPLAYSVSRKAFGGTEAEIPHFALGEREVWGATAMILAELSALLGQP